MPVITFIPPDPTDLVMQGEQMRASVMEAPVAALGNVQGTEVVSGFSSLVQDEDAFAPMNSMIETNRLATRRMKDGVLLMRANAGIATPCGAWIWLNYGPLLNPLLWSSEMFAITGQTVTGTGAALGNCRVVVYETGRIAVTATPVRTYYSTGNPNPQGWESPSPVVAEAISDGSGNFTISVPMNTAYQLTGYLTGSPDLAGITRQDVVPTNPLTLIYLRNPTTPDTPGGGGNVFILTE